MKHFITLIICFASLAATAQRDESGQTDEKTPAPLYVTARLDGTIKTKLETSTEDGAMRFNVRNSRLGLRGSVGGYVDYRIQVELSNEGIFSPLDLYGSLKPAPGLTVNFGQTHVPFDNDYIITPADMMFANRAFAGKFFTPGSRDIGVVAHYKFKRKGFPMELQGGIFNGGKINSPQWTSTPSYAFRLLFGAMEGWRTTAKIYRYHTPADDLFFAAADLRYATHRFRVETELTNRHDNTTGRDLSGAYLQGAYTFPVKGGMFHSISPAARWDAMGYGAHKGFEINRLTFGLDFGLSDIPFRSVLRLDYEHYFAGKGSAAYFDGRDMHTSDNKMTLELVLKF
jgi:hypothetical protein